MAGKLMAKDSSTSTAAVNMITPRQTIVHLISFMVLLTSSSRILDSTEIVSAAFSIVSVSSSSPVFARSTRKPILYSIPRDHLALHTLLQIHPTLTPNRGQAGFTISPKQPTRVKAPDRNNHQKQNSVKVGCTEQSQGNKHPKTSKLPPPEKKVPQYTRYDKK